MRSARMEEIRNALKAFSEADAISLGQVQKLVGAETKEECRMVRRRIQELIERGEVERDGQCALRYIPGREPRRYGKSYVRAWKIIRIQPPGWSKSTIVSIARVSGTVVQRYVKFLEEEGYVAKIGRDGGTTLWRTTQKGQAEREIPWPPLETQDAYAQERTATAALCTLMLTSDLDKEYAREKIRKHLAVLNQKFCSQVENNSESEGESHV